MDRNQANSEEERRLRGATSWQWKFPPAAERITGPLQGYLENRERSFRKSETLVDAWREVLPPVLVNICRLKEYKSGTLFVEVMPGPYLQQMHMMQQDLLRELQRRCPRSGLRKITFVPLCTNQE